MNSLRGLDITRKCQLCNLKSNGFLCNLSPAAMKEFEAIKYSSMYPANSMLFLENEPARGIYVLCSGEVKLSVSSRGGKTLILRIARPGDILGITSNMSGAPYQASAETLHPCQVAFIRREDFMTFLRKYPEVYQTVVQQLTGQYATACEQLRTVGLSTSAHEKLARLILHWSHEGKATPEGTQIKVPLTHEQIAECVGSTRETVTRTLSEFKHRHLVTLKGATMVISNPAALGVIGGS
ncbi:MAG TPA: Crp/Fnr family transcriptional regulator [Acidobacteriaceae bacterium]|nr:Crp/Fnr family transcriptional regulator [Acidobacteriaceae bacterium]